MSHAVATTATAPTTSGSWWSNIGASIAGAADAFGQAFLTKELAKIEAATQSTIANANAQAAIAQSNATTAAANAAAQAQQANANASGGLVIPGWLKWAGGGALVFAVGYAVLRK